MTKTARAIPALDPTLPRSVGGYILVEHVARGGMADVYLALDTDNRLVIVKQVRASLGDSPRYDELLIAEANLSMALRHVNIARAFDSGRDDEGAPYAVFEFVDGIDLRDLLRLCSRRKVALPVASSLHVVRELLRGLDHAHRARAASRDKLDVVHRDVTPSNVLLSFDGDVKLCDFGIASATIMPAVPEDRIEGKTGYLSPEHAQSRKLDKRSDLYAVGIILWELLAGRRMRPNKGQPALDSAKRGEVPPVVLRGLPHEERLLAIVHRALAKRVDDRYPSAGAMLRDLDSYCVAAGIDISPVDLAGWLDVTLSAERHDALSRKARARAMALDLRQSMAPPALPESGVRRIQSRDERCPAPTTQELLGLGAWSALVSAICTASVFVVMNAIYLSVVAP